MARSPVWSVTVTAATSSTHRRCSVSSRADTAACSARTVRESSRPLTVRRPAATSTSTRRAPAGGGGGADKRSPREAHTRRRGPAIVLRDERRAGGWTRGEHNRNGVVSTTDLGVCREPGAGLPAGGSALRQVGGGGLPQAAVHAVDRDRTGQEPLGQLRHH